MLESLQIKDFQRHEKLRVDFEQITTIVGPSDAGKSAIIRALLWVLTNQPSGEAFIRHGTKETAVRLLMEGHSIVRKKGKDNVYLLDDEEFRSFRNAVPDTIADILQVGEINYQRQHDASFWVSLTAGEVSRQLNAIVDLSTVDACLTIAKNRVREKNRWIDNLQQRLERDQKALTSLSWAEQAAIECVDLQEKEADLEEQQRNLSLLEEALTSWSFQKTEIDVVTSKIEGLVPLGRQSHAITEDEDQIVALSTLISRWPDVVEVGPLSDPPEGMSQLESQIDELGRLVNSWQEVVDVEDLPTMPDDTTELTQTIETLGRLVRGWELIDDVEDLSQRHAKIEEELEAFAVCPLCGKPND